MASARVRAQTNDSDSLQRCSPALVSSFNFGKLVTYCGRGLQPVGGNPCFLGVFIQVQREVQRKHALNCAAAECKAFHHQRRSPEIAGIKRENRACEEVHLTTGL